MFNVGICDDEEYHRRILIGSCESFFKANSISGTCTVFSSKEAVLEYDGDEMTVLFFELGSREKEKNVLLYKLGETKKFFRVICMSNQLLEIVELINFGIFEIWNKPVKEKKVHLFLRNVMFDKMKPDRFKSMEFAGTQNLDPLKIIWLSANGNYTMIYTENEACFASGQIHEWEMKLSEYDIIRCHKSHLVNMLYVEHIFARHIRLRAKDVVLPIGYSYAAKFREAYQKIMNRTGKTEKYTESKKAICFVTKGIPDLKKLKK